MKKSGNLPSDRNSNNIMVFPLKKGCFGSTTGADIIDTTDMVAIKFDAEVAVYVDGDSANTYILDRAEPAGVEYCDSIHVDAAVDYVWM